MAENLRKRMRTAINSQYTNVNVIKNDRTRISEILDSMVEEIFEGAEDTPKNKDEFERNYKSALQFFTAGKDFLMRAKLDYMCEKKDE